MSIDDASLKISLFHGDGVVRAQRWMKGNVTVIVRKDTEIRATDNDNSAGQLFVHVVGKETSSIPNACTCMLSSCTCHGKDEVIVLNEHIMIHDFFADGRTTIMLLPGEEYSYPFSVYLPGSLPTSMEYHDTLVDNCTSAARSGCSVRYDLTADLRVVCSGASTVIHTSHELEVVGQTLSNKSYPFSFPPRCFPIMSSLRNFDGIEEKDGYIVVATKVDNTHIGKGRSLDFAVACQNQSSEYIQRVDIQFLEEIVWRIKGGAATNNSKKNEMRRTLVLASYEDVELPSLVKENIGTTDGLIGDRHEELQRLRSRIDADLKNPRNTVALRVPEESHVSYQANRLLQVSHCLRIIFVVKGRLSDPHIDIPLQVFDPPMEVIAPNQAHQPLKSKLSEMATTTWQQGAVVHTTNSFKTSNERIQVYGQIVC